MNISKKQEEIINTKYDKVVVMAAAASGKTACITERAKVMLERGINPDKMVVITFTVAAADEMSKRIGKVDGLFVGTIHAYAYYLLSAAGFQEHAREYVEKEQFDELFYLIQKHPQCIKPVDYLIVDEAQDCSYNEWKFFEFIQPEGFMYCGDLRQCIYEWRDACPKYLLTIMKQSDVEVYSLNENYRNDKEILSYAKWIISRQKHGLVDDSICMSSRKGNVENISFDKYEIVNIIKANPDYREWFILTRTNDQSDLIRFLLDKYNIPNITFKRGGKNFDELNALINEDKVKILTIHTAKGLEADNVMVIGANMYKDEEIRLSYVAATRARHNLYWVKREQKKYNNWE